jgi:hypothetical protein
MISVGGVMILFFFVKVLPATVHSSLQSHPLGGSLLKPRSKSHSTRSSRQKEEIGKRNMESRFKYNHPFETNVLKIVLSNLSMT